MDTNRYEDHVSDSTCNLLPDDGICTAFHVCRRYQGYEILDR